jgi:membrane fusion protein, multidrug efflux system
MPSDQEPKSLTGPDGTYDDLWAELEEVRARQRQLEEKYERRANGHAKSTEAEPGKKEQEKPGSEVRKEHPPEKPKKRPLRQRLAFFPREHPLGFAIALIVVAILLVGGYLLLGYLASYESTDDAQVSAHIHPVGARVNGTVIAVFVENTQSVTPNETLVELDPRDYQAAVTRAEGNLAQAQGQLSAENPNVPITQTTNITTVSTAQSDVASAEAALAAAQHDYDAALADLRQAEADNGNAQADEVRYRDLVDKDEVPREQFDAKLAAAQAAAAAVSARRASADAAQKMIPQREAALAQARSRLAEARNNSPRQLDIRQAAVSERQGTVEMAKAQLRQARLNLSYCTISAPLAGIVGNRYVEVGQRVQAGEQLMDITQMDDFWVDANFKETQIRRMRPGQSVTLHVDALGRDFSGYVENIAGATGAEYSLLPPENATGNYVKVVQRLPVRIRLRKGQPGLERLRPGMSVEPKVWLQ